MSNKAEEQAEIVAAREKVKDWSRDDLIAECLNLYDRLDRTNEILRLTSAELGSVRKKAEESESAYQDANAAYIDARDELRSHGVL